MDPKEVLASLQLLVAVAKANGTIAEEEREAIAEALQESKLPGEYTVDSLLAENTSLDSVLAVIQSEEGRKHSFSAAYLLAYADGDYSPEEKAIIDDLKTRWNIPESEVTELNNTLIISQGSITASTGPASQEERLEDSQQIIKVNRILAALVGALPLPVVGDLMVLGVQIRMVSQIGKVYGRELDKVSIKALLGTLGVGTGARLAVSSLSKFIPGYGTVVGATLGFAATHAVGQVAIKYFESGGTLSTDAMKSAFKELKAEGEKEYHASKADLEANKDMADKLADLGKQLKAGTINQQQYDEAIAKLTVKV